MILVEDDESLRERGLTAPAVAISAHDEALAREQTQPHGIAHFLVKPFRDSALVRSVDAAMDQRRDGGGP